jgi:hypothetical protein
VDSGRSEHAAAGGQRMIRHVVEDDVVAVRPLGEVFLRVVDDVIRADRSNRVDVPRAADPGLLYPFTAATSLRLVLDASNAAFGWLLLLMVYCECVLVATPSVRDSGGE